YVGRGHAHVVGGRGPGQGRRGGGDRRGRRVAGGGGRLGVVAGRFVREPEPVREQRRLAVTVVDRLLREAPHPRHRQLAGRLDGAEQHVGDALPLGARQPGGDQRVPAGKLVGDVHRAAGDQHHGQGDAGGAQPVEGGAVGRVEAEAAGPVALALGVRGLADDGHRDVVRAVYAGAVAAVPDGGAGVPDALEDGGAGGDVPGGALPGDGPAAALVADV